MKCLAFLLLLLPFIACNKSASDFAPKNGTGVTASAYVVGYNKNGVEISRTSVTSIRNFDATKQAMELTFEVADSEEGDYFKAFGSLDAGKTFSERLLLFADVNQRLYTVKINP